ncbi:MAG: NAD(P)H-hydrate dehydratase [Paenibacillus sp. RIFOXYA1_FULL_44_5]|nr:MAG: NAD(P)H-hydrate dehydratase [Paenibacillus sp. RIFOXYA1_FULL_44_5]
MPDDLLPHLAGHVPEVMLAGITRSGEAAVSSHSADLSRSVYGQWKSTDSTQIAKLAESRDTLAVGPGMGRFEGDSLFVRSIWENVQLPLVLDADALNAIADAGDFASWPKRSAAVILTPHPGEMARLLGVSTQEVQRDRIETARRFASQHGITLVLKGTHTVIAAPDGRVYVNPTGNAGMSTGGAGDVLTGIIAGLLAQGLDAIQAACLGVYLHGEAGDRAAAKRQHMRSLIAGDILNEL